MKKRAMMTVLLLTLLFATVSPVSAQGGDVYVVPVKGEIMEATATFVREKVEEYRQKDAALIVFEIDTYGGRIDAAETIKNAILDAGVPTVSWVNNKAESAGVLITIAGEKVFMKSSATIGSAETIPNTEKILSMWRSMLRDVAQVRNRDGRIIVGMADANLEIPGIKEKGELLNLTSQEALIHGIADDTADTVEEVLALSGHEGKTPIVAEKDITLKAAEILSNNAVSTLLLVIGLVGLVVEVFMPGFGIPGAASVLAFGLFFAGNVLSGESQLAPLFLFVLGFIMLGVEAVVPGFGLPGISGIILIVSGIVLSMGNVMEGLASISVAIIAAAVVAIVLVKRGFKSRLFRNIVLDTANRVEPTLGGKEPQVDYYGKEGTAITALRPAGTIEIDGVRLDALTEGEFIEREAAIRVIKVVGSKIFVTRR